MEALHASLRTETDILRSDVARERQRLREERQEFEAQKRDLIHRSQQSRDEAEVRTTHSHVHVHVHIRVYNVLLGAAGALTTHWVFMPTRA